MKGREGDPQDKDGMGGGGAALYHTHTDKLLHETLPPCFEHTYTFQIY